jgi:hypothetical protein
VESHASTCKRPPTEPYCGSGSPVIFGSVTTEARRTPWTLRGHGAGNLFFVAKAPADLKARRRLEAALIFEFQPPYCNFHKKRAPLVLSEYLLKGDVPKSCLRSNPRLQTGARPARLGRAAVVAGR